MLFFSFPYLFFPSLPRLLMPASLVLQVLYEFVRCDSFKIVEIAFWKSHGVSGHLIKPHFVLRCHSLLLMVFVRDKYITFSVSCTSDYLVPLAFGICFLWML